MADMTRQTFFDCVLERDGVDDGGEHAHVVCSDAVHVDGLLGDSAEEVAASDDDADLAAEGVDGGYLCCDLVDEDGVDAETGACGEGFSGELEEDSFVHVRSKYRMLELSGVSSQLSVETDNRTPHPPR